METTIGFVPVSELVPDVCVQVCVCCTTSASSSWSQRPLWFGGAVDILAVTSLLYVAEVSHDDPGLSKQTH